MAIDLTFQLLSKTAKHSFWTIENCELRPIGEADNLSTLSLTCQASWVQYQQIKAQQLFHYKPELQGHLSAGAFLPDQSVILELLLKPESLDTVPLPLRHSLDPEGFHEHWQKLVEHDPQASLIQSDSWYLQTVNQKQSNGLVGYRTAWSYLEPTMLGADVQMSPQLFSCLNEFIQDSQLAGDILPNYDDEAFDKLLRQSADFLQNSMTLLRENGSHPGSQTSAIVDDIIDNVVRISVETMPAIADEEDSVPLLRTVMDFLTEGEIEFEYSIDASALRFDYVGQHGEWTCYAKTQEKNHVFVFYSIPTFQVPPEKITDVLYYICEANYGLVMGNLEMNITDGEIRYKTSIDVEDDTLSPELVRNMMYANVTLMDQYLPGLMAIIQQGKSSADALALVEA
ncbi:MAG: YbjN domain-containing protein [Cyanobacteria bacterium J06642_11]